MSGLSIPMLMGLQGPRGFKGDAGLSIPGPIGKPGNSGKEGKRGRIGRRGLRGFIGGVGKPSKLTISFLIKIGADLDYDIVTLFSTDFKRMGEMEPSLTYDEIVKVSILSCVTLPSIMHITVEGDNLLLEATVENTTVIELDDLTIKDGMRMTVTLQW